MLWLKNNRQCRSQPHTETTHVNLEMSIDSHCTRSALAMVVGCVGGGISKPPQTAGISSSSCVLCGKALMIIGASGWSAQSPFAQFPRGSSRRKSIDPRTSDENCIRCGPCFLCAGCRVHVNAILGGFWTPAYRLPYTMFHGGFFDH